MPPLRWLFLYLSEKRKPHWGSNRVGQPKGSGGFAFLAIATRSAAPIFIYRCGKEKDLYRGGAGANLLALYRATRFS